MLPGDEHVAETEVCTPAGRLGTVSREPHPRGLWLFLTADKESSSPGTASLLWEIPWPPSYRGASECPHLPTQQGGDGVITWLWPTKGLMDSDSSLGKG